MALVRIASLACLAPLLAAPAAAQCQEHKLLRAEGNAFTPNGFSFAISAALEGTTAVVGSHLDDTTGQLLGAVHVFELGGAAPQEVQKIVPTNVAFGAQFGWRVAMSGNWLAVAAQNDHPGVLSAGSVSIYNRPAGPGTPFVLSRKLTASPPQPGAHFGHSIAMWDDRLVVGADDDGTLAAHAGAAHVLERQANGTWIEVAKLTASDPEPFAFFGTAVAIHGDTVLVSAVAKDDPVVGQDVGAVYAFERDAFGTWSQTQKLTTSQPQALQYSGTAVALGADSAFIQAQLYDDPAIGTNSGALFAFSRTPGGWVESQKLRISDPGPGLGFGVPTLQGNRLLVAANDDDHGPSSGSVYVFDRIGTSWMQTGKILADDGSFSDALGISVALWDDTALVGALRTDDACPSNPNCNSGAAYVFSLASDTIQGCSCPAGGGPCGNDDEHGGCANSTGQGAVLSACGSGSVAQDDLKLVGRWMPPSTFALLFMGGVPWPSGPFGDGRLCVGPGGSGIQRFPLGTTDASGSASFGPGLAAFSQTFANGGPIQPGQTRFFQIWYRDPAGPCGTSSNLSNSIGVQFRP